MIPIALVGMTTKYTENYIYALKSHPRFYLAAACTTDERMKTIFHRILPEKPLYTTPESMLAEHPELKAVILTSENVRHIHDFELCAKHGTDILLDKIPTMNLDEYDRMIQLTVKYGILCQVEAMIDFNPVVRRLHETVACLDGGNVKAVQITGIGISPVNVFPWYADPQKSFGACVPLDAQEKQFCGGALCDHVHVFDLARMLTHSEFDTIYAQCGPMLHPNMGVEDIVSVTARMKNGVIVSLDPSWSRRAAETPRPDVGWEIDPKPEECTIQICMENGIALADCFSQNIYSDGGPNRRYTVHSAFPDGITALIDNFSDSILSRRTDNDLLWHRKNIEAIHACYESIRTQQAIQL